MSNSKVAIGFIIYGKSTSKYLPYFLSSIKIQTYADYKVFAIDNSLEIDNENVEIINNQDWFDIDYTWVDGNLGFSKAYNILIEKIVKEGFDYFLIVNPDTIWDENALKKMVESLENDAELGSVSPKILRWDFEKAKKMHNNPLSIVAKTNVIDSCGIAMKSGLRFYDIGQSELDLGQYDNDYILGPSGACMFLRVEALRKIAIKETKVAESDKVIERYKYFDEMMFMYKEDCDLVYRLFLKGYKSKVVGKALVYHDRTAFGVGEGDVNIAKARKFKGKQVKKWSFLNQNIIFIKYWKLMDKKSKFWILWFQFRAFVWIILFEWYLLPVYKEVWKMKDTILEEVKKEYKYRMN